MGQQCPAADRGEDQARQRDQQEMPDRGQVRGEQAAKARASQAAEAPGRVESRHHRTADRGDHVHGDAVHRDVQAPVRGTEHQQGQPERQRGMRERREQQRGGQ
jgi:hypothetical protein